MIYNNLTKVIIISLILRLINSISIKTFFQPDEYWQSLEISHNLIFDYGYKTWEWRALGLEGGIRSPLYPYLFVPIYSLLKRLQLDDTILLTLAPRLLQGCFASCCDVATWLLAIKLLGPIYANVALLCSLTSFFHAYTLTRTFSNSMETTLTTIAFALWPWNGLNFTSSTASGDLKGKDESSIYPQFTSLAASLTLASLATIMRPSNAIIWIILGIHLLYSNRKSSALYYVLNTTLIVTIISLSFCYYLDTSFYFRPTFTPYNFLVQNVYNSIALFYGQNPFHFYFTQALPVMTFLLLPYVLHGWWISRSNSKIKVVNWIIGGTTLVYSCLGHKEFRFVHPLLPLLHIVASSSLVHFFQSSSSTTKSTTTIPSLPIKTLHIFLITLNLLPAIYLNTYHSIGQIEILSVLKKLPVEELKSVAFLMPCHSTPWMSHLHRLDLMEGGRYSGEGGKSWFLTCEPPVLGQDPTTYLDQSDYFYQNPSLYLLTRFPHVVNPKFPPSPFPRLYDPKQFDNDQGWKHTWPSHLVVFQDLLNTKDSLVDGNGTIGDIFKAKGYIEVERLWNSHFHDDDRRRGDVVLLKWMP